MAITVGTNGHFSASLSTGAITITTVGTAGVLVLMVESNDGTGPTVSSTTLGSWGTVRAQITGGNGEYEWTMPFSSGLTNEVITLVGGGSFITMDVLEVNGVPTISYFDGTAVTSAGGVPFAISTTTNNVIVIAGIRDTTSSGTRGPGWTAVGTPADFHVMEYMIVTAPQNGLLVTLGGGQSSNGAIADALIASSQTDTLMSQAAL